jgi:hypothetical protein
MSNLKTIQSVAEKHGLFFVRTNSLVNGIRLYNFETYSGHVVAANWTIASAINEHNFGDLDAKIA